MNRFARRLTLAALVIGASCGFANDSMAGELHRVELKNGRKMAGEIDRRSNEKQLVLRVKTQSVTVLRTVRRDTIQTITPIQPRTSTAKFRKVASPVRSTMAQQAKAALIDPRLDRTK